MELLGSNALSFSKTFVRKVYSDTVISRCPI